MDKPEQRTLNVLKDVDTFLDKMLDETITNKEFKQLSYTLHWINQHLDLEAVTKCAHDNRGFLTNPDAIVTVINNPMYRCN